MNIGSLSIADSITLAIRYQLEGRLDVAEAVCRQILTGDSQQFAVLHLLGVIVAQKGDFDQAIALVQRAALIQPDFHPAYRTLGQLYVSRHELSQAVVSYRLVTRLCPDDPAAWFALAVVLRMNKNPGEAIPALEQAVRLNPADANAFSELGALLLFEGKNHDGLRMFEKAITLCPGSAGFHSNLASALAQLDRLEEAEVVYRRAIQLSPQTALLHSNLGDLFIRRRQYEVALEYFRAAIQIEPGLARAHTGRGVALGELHRFDEAIASHILAVEIAPQSAPAHLALSAAYATVRDMRSAEGGCRRAVELDPDSDVAWYRLAHVLTSLGQFEEALVCLRRSLAIRANPSASMLLSSIELRTDDAEIQGLRSALAGANLSSEDRAAAGFALAKMLDEADRFDEAFACYATANQVFRDLMASDGIRYSADRERRDSDCVIETFTPSFFDRVYSWGDPDELPVFIVGMPRSGTTLIEQIAASHSQVFGAGELGDMTKYAAELKRKNDSARAWDPADVLRLAIDYKRKLISLGGGVLRVTDKMPDNLGHLGLIATMFPNARVIFCRRDPRDTCLSCYFQMFGKKSLMFSYDLADCASAYLQHERLMQHWETALPLRMLTIDYEQLVADLEGQSRRLIEFLGLGWESKCLDFHRTSRVVTTASAWQVRQPIYTRSVGRWKHYEKHLGPLIAALEGKTQT